MDEPAFRHVINHLLATGGTDVLLIDGRMYRLTAEQLGENAPRLPGSFWRGKTMPTHEWSHHWRDIEHVRDQCTAPDTCIGGDATVREALEHAQRHEPAVWMAFTAAAAKTFSEGGHRADSDMNRAVELALDHYLAAQTQGRAA